MAAMTGGALLAEAAKASVFSGDALDSVANVMALVVLFIVPVVVIALFWLVHILPEKVAEQRHHPQKDAIKALCLLSLVFGGLLWPLAWILAYSKPTLYKLAYGRDKHDDYYRGLAEREGANAAELGGNITRLRTELDALAIRGKLPEELREIRERLVAIEAQVVPPRSAEDAG